MTYANTEIKFKRIEAGHYVSEDGRFVIERRGDLWSVTDTRAFSVTRNVRGEWVVTEDCVTGILTGREARDIAARMAEAEFGRPRYSNAIAAMVAHYREWLRPASLNLLNPALVLAHAARFMFNAEAVASLSDEERRAISTAIGLAAVRAGVAS
jgi:hypothetical protein